MSDNKWQKMAEEPTDQEPLVEEEAVAADEELGLDFPDRQKLEDQLTVLEQRELEAKNKMLAMQAELDNVRKRAERDVQNAHRYGADKILTALLPVIDSLTRALEGGEPADEKAKALFDGTALTLELLESTLAKFGVEAILPAVGDALNPEQHEVMTMMPVEGQEANTIAQTLQKGYLLNGRVIRAAMVAVAQ